MVASIRKRSSTRNPVKGVAPTREEMFTFARALHAIPGHQKGEIFIRRMLRAAQRKARPDSSEGFRMMLGRRARNDIKETTASARRILHK